MTALKPIENRRVRGVASETYPVNKTCSHPECSEPVTLKANGDPTVHHIFPRSLTKSASYFVEITEDEGKPKIIPHATGLCGSGTSGHHGEVELHDAWIKLEDGVYVWYDRGEGDEWIKVGPLNPQPGSTDGKPKRKRLKGEKRKKRKTISLRVPDDADENGAELFDEAVEQLEEKLNPGNHRPLYFTLMTALDYTNLNADATDFE
jgi:hypothetical protein